MKRTTLIQILILSAVFLTWFPVHQVTSEEAHLHLTPKEVLIGAMYNGGRISVVGKIPEDTEIMIVMSGKRVDAELLKKGRVCGLLWMNTGSVTFHNAPLVYKVFAPGKFLTTGGTARDHVQRNKEISFETLKQEIDISPAQENKDKLFEEFLKLKEHQGMYSITENAINYHEAENGMKSMSCDIAIPCKVPPGTYSITSYVYRDDTLLVTDHRDFQLKETGLPKLITTLAFEHGTIYGILATIIALVAGLFIGIVFRGDGGSH